MPTVTPVECDTILPDSQHSPPAALSHHYPLADTGKTSIVKFESNGRLRDRHLTEFVKGCSMSARVR